ncbi:MarR family transcriptional regulator [Streptomyces sp. SID4919]|uniref:MarR family winged helix-turn-helix transcriptional regulator n=1 Tax=unclassified Streptomyces TaxID=2593676 RepID=UPI0008239D7F|nr:MarR family winged helix-turn-helix transcriptional regulator [Streptomyces sp. AmelKG-E11A]MYY10505.1 MarR family transcriptional regulator [Streptomyces sp. SID4919]SCK47005.1 DNA-binding transcriptional regulator, MarR family [Streptomyces sp. AmelKG-E11A]
MTGPETVPPPAGGAPSLEDALSSLQCVLVARRAGTCPEPINWQQYDVLEILRVRGPMTPSLLSGSLGVSRQTVSKSLRVVKDLGLVVQAALGEDRREQTTSLTRAGHVFLARNARGRRENARAAMSVLDPDEREAFARMCQKAADAIKELLPEQPPQRH